MITVAIPVGPNPKACRWLDEAIGSVLAQSTPCNLLILDDMHGVGDPHCPAINWNRTRIWRSPWRLGVAHAFNFCVALAPDDEVLMLGADDTLEPDAVEVYMKASSWDSPEVRDHTYYSLPVRYMVDDHVQFEPCNAAVVSKGLWRSTGGFPVESASGAPDAAFLSQIWNSTTFMIKSIADRPLYNYRSHPDTDTASKGPWQGVILETRNLLTELFTPYPHWGRYR